MKLLSAALAFATMVVVSTVLLAFLGSGLNTHVAAGALICATIVALAAWVTTASPTLPKARFWDQLMLIVFALVSLRAFLWLVYKRGDEICVLSPNNLGDLSLHLNLIRYLASGIAFWPESSILSNVPLTYPLGSDLFNSVLEVLGVDTFAGLIWTGLAGAALAGYALWLWGGAFGLAAFLFNGGLTGFAILRTFELEDFQSEMVWKNLFLSMFVTQRGLLMALPGGLILLYAWRERYFRGSKHLIPLWVQLLIYASLPLFNIHAFFFLSLLLAAILAAQLAAARSWNPLAAGAPRELFAFVALALVPATLSILLVTGFFSMAGAIRWAPGWVAGGNLWGWIWNFGLTLPLSLVLAFMLFLNKDSEARCFVWTAVCIFALCCIVSFASWEWDNMKLMLWSWLVIAPYLWTKVIAKMNLAARVAVCVVLFFSGAVSLIGGLDARHGYALARRSELDAWKHALAGIPPEVRFACVPDYNHPLVLLGRKVACGYEGHLWSHGLNCHQNLDLLRKALVGGAAWRDVASSLDVQWLALRKADLPEVKPPGDPPPDDAFGALYDFAPIVRQDPASLEARQLRPQSVDLPW
jgi:hypothetical protein